MLPQLDGLGRSEMARRYGISGREEAVAYLAHPVLGTRVRACARALLESGERDPVAVMGQVDARKLQSSMTLFDAVGSDVPLFGEVLDRYFEGERDEQTIALLT